MQEHFGLSAACCGLPEVTVLCKGPSQNCVLGILLEIPSTGSGPTNSDAAACLASSSAVSFPGTLLYPGTQSKRTLLKVESFLSAVLVSSTRLDLVLAEDSAFNAA